MRCGVLWELPDVVLVVGGLIRACPWHVEKIAPRVNTLGSKDDEVVRCFRREIEFLAAFRQVIG